jgi:hypothetical protein
MPKTAKELPIRPKALKESDEPRFAKSYTDIEEPIRVMPKTENFEPRRPKALRDKVLPRCKKSRTDSDEPRRA